MIRNLLEKLLVYMAVGAVATKKPTIIAVTGSVGKTTTREAIYAVLSSKFSVRRNDKNYNNLIGTSLTILGLPAPHTLSLKIKLILGLFFKIKSMPEYFVLEYGADRPGDIAMLASYFKPNISVVTAVGELPVHVENYPSLESVALEKSNLVSLTDPKGLVILNRDDEKVANMATLTGAEKIFFSRKDILSDKIIIDENGRIGRNIIVRLCGYDIQFELYNIIASHQFMAMIPALLIGYKLGLSFDEMKIALENFEFPVGRVKVLRGLNGSTLIDDSYNASPLSTSEALSTLEEVKKIFIAINKPKKVIAYLGEMKELGQFAPGAHFEIGKKASYVCDVLIAVGTDNASHLVRGFKSVADDTQHKEIYIFQDSKEASEFAVNKISSDDMVLIKGSQSMRMEFVTKALLQDKNSAYKLLPRQTADWL